jgi:hypothetical protein
MDGMAEVHQLRPRSPRWGAQWPIGVVLLCVIASLAVVALDQFRIGSLMLAGSLALAFGLRLVLPADRVGMLAVRSRSVDLVVLGVLATALLVFSLSVPPPP